MRLVQSVFHCQPVDRPLLLGQLQSRHVPAPTRAHRDEQRYDRFCSMCDAVIDYWERTDKLFCSNACRQKYYRDCGGPPIRLTNSPPSVRWPVSSVPIDHTGDTVKVVLQATGGPGIGISAAPGHACGR